MEEHQPNAGSSGRAAYAAPAIARLPISACEIVGHNDREVQIFCDRLDPADQINSRADYREIETVCRADIAVDNGAGMQPHDDPKLWFARQSKLVAKPAHRRKCLDRCLKRVACRSHRRVRRFDWKNRQQPVADEF